MGNFFTAFFSLLFTDAGPTSYVDQSQCTYALYDPTQIVKPKGRSKDIISSKHRENPTALDRYQHLGCDTVWKCFKRSVWRNPDRPFLGTRKKMQ